MHITRLCTEKTPDNLGAVGPYSTTVTLPNFLLHEFFYPEHSRFHPGTSMQSRVFRSQRPARRRRRAPTHFEVLHVQFGHGLSTGLVCAHTTRVSWQRYSEQEKLSWARARVINGKTIDAYDKYHVLLICAHRPLLAARLMAVVVTVDAQTFR
jgi:hypothetical protein